MADDLFSNLPVDIIFDILSRLPLKTISNCKYLNKTWLNLVLHPRFAEIHFSRSVQTRSSPCILYTTVDNSPNLISGESFDNLKPLALSYNVKIHELLGNNFTVVYETVGSVNGLICYSHQNKYYYICNPVTGDCILLPNTPSNTEPVAVGFGFDHVSNDYKVVRVLRGNSGNGNEVEVYTLGSSSWREMETNVEYVISTTLCSVVLNECVHWVAHKSYSSFSVVILLFDVVTEEFSIFELPMVLNRNILGFRELRGQLCVTYGAIFGEREMWVMSIYGDDGSWVDYCVDEYTGELGVQEIELRSGKLLLLTEDMELVYYDVHEETCVQVEVRNFEGELVRMRQPVFLIGSLFSPKNLGYH